MAYASDRADGSNLDIWVQQVDGSGSVRLTDDPADDYEQSFSPDGSQIAFRSERANGGIYLVPALGGEARLLVPGGHQPRFSPDGQQLVFKHREDQLCLQRLSGGAPVVIAQGCTEYGSVAWSPDGRRILFGGLCGGKSAIWLWTLDGKLSPVPGLERGRVFQWLANPPRLLISFQHDQRAYFGKYSETSVAEIPVSVTDGVADDKPHFSNDDRFIFFTGIRDGFRCIWGQKIGPDMHPVGTPFAVYLLHQRRNSLSRPDGGQDIAVGQNLIVFNRSDLEGNVWLMEPGKSAHK